MTVLQAYQVIDRLYPAVKPAQGQARLRALGPLLTTQVQLDALLSQMAPPARADILRGLLPFLHGDLVPSAR